MYAFAIIAAFLILPGPSSIYSDNLGSLASTLKDMHRTACDDELVSLACPTGTVVNVQAATYGNGTRTCENAKPGQQTNDGCLWPNSMQYSLLQTVVEACQKKKNCQFSTALMAGAPDPCPMARKFVRVAYKCRPYEFRSIVACENQTLTLGCNPYSRIAVYDAEFGRTLFSTECSQKGMPDENCKALIAGSKVMQSCHGKRRCEVLASRTIFGNPCNRTNRMYLKVVFACVNSEKWNEVNATPMVNPAVQPPWAISTPATTTTDLIATKHEDAAIDNTGSPSSRNIAIYVGVSVLLFIIFIVLLIAVRCYITRKHTRNSKNGDMFIAEAPNVFNDAVSDIDNDIDVTHMSGTFYDPVHPDMILYRDVPGSKGTLRAMRPLSTIYPCAGASMYGHLDYVPPQYREVAAGRLSREASREKEDVEIDHEVVVSPKSLNRFSNSQYYYG
ncbi:protein eva-1 homolog C-like isoform X2 [Cydia splendana]|uniref:protein eva-1 homolog C-like isoform X2 n=1 Tax=Cydia splendana TaxID=1100963 RepID=UPI00300D489E